MFKKMEERQKNVGLNLLNAIANNTDNIVSEAIVSEDVKYMTELQKALDSMLAGINLAKPKLDKHLENINGKAV